MHDIKMLILFEHDAFLFFNIFKLQSPILVFTVFTVRYQVFLSTFDPLIFFNVRHRFTRQGKISYFLLHVYRRSRYVQYKLVKVWVFLKSIVSYFKVYNQQNLTVSCVSHLNKTKKPQYLFGNLVVNKNSTRSILSKNCEIYDSCFTLYKY